MSSTSTFFTGSLPGSFVTTPSIVARPVGFAGELPATCATALTLSRTISSHADRCLAGGNFIRRDLTEPDCIEPWLLSARLPDSNGKGLGRGFPASREDRPANIIILPRNGAPPKNRLRAAGVRGADTECLSCLCD